jgi:hypothetical protein
MRLVSLLRARLTALLAAALFAVALAGCGPAAVTRTRVERGETVTTGVTAYDAFFRELGEANGEIDKVAAEVSSAAKPLKDAIGAQGKGTPPEVMRSEAKKLQTSGTLLHLQLVPDTKVVTSGKPDAPTEKLLAAAEQAAKGSLAVARRADEVLARIADLEKRRAELVDTASTSFPQAAKRNEITRELAAAEAVLASARAAVERHGGTASKLVLDLAMALETGAGTAVAAVVKKPTKPGGGSKPGGGGKPGGTGAVAPARPKGDDFDR